MTKINVSVQTNRTKSDCDPPKRAGGNRFVYKLEEKQGVYWRVIPSNMKEIKFMLLLDKHSEYEIPSFGNGLLITDHIIPLP